jgi:glucose/arabinose dehydrogenase
VTLREVATGLDQPTEIVNAGDGSGRLFIVEKTGLIRILRNGALLPAPFLDVRSQVSTSGEQGLLGLAFHPRYASNGRFFVYYTERNSGALHVSAFQVSATNAEVADRASERTLLVVPHPGFSNHNGGRLAFGPDGHLYVGTGDGGSGGDPSNHAQNLDSRLGKLLRMNVDDASPAAETWAYGLRNPWKFTFDRVAGDLYIADVGQGRIEEIDFVPFGTPAGLNFGWRVFEGAECFGGSGCALANHTPPVITYAHDNAGGRSVTGGYVYRGNASIALRGYYLYGDFESNRMWAARREDGQWRVFVVIEPGTLSGISTFGEDEAGELYVASFGDGRIFAITAPGPAANPLERTHVDAAGNVVGNPWGRRAR